MGVGSITSSTAVASLGVQSTVAMSVLARAQRDQQEQAEALLRMMRDSAAIAAADGHVDIYA